VISDAATKAFGEQLDSASILLTKASIDIVVAIVMGDENVRVVCPSSVR
jgi:hypothetical protein